MAANTGMVDLSLLEQTFQSEGPSTMNPMAHQVNHLDLKFAAFATDAASMGESDMDRDVLSQLISFTNAPSIPAEEKKLWELALTLFKDCEQSRRYDPAVIGIAHVPNERRWFVSQYAHIQDVLLRHTKLRRMALILQWLEQTAETNRSAPDPTHPLELTYQLIFGCIRRGDIRNAMKHAEVTHTRAVACSLEGIQLNAAKEVWQTRTACIPLFGEYANAEVEQGWANNDHRLNLLGSLHEEASQDVPSEKTELVLEKAICGALCGNFDATVKPFGTSRRWQDELWAKLRSILIPIFTKVLLNFGHNVNSASYVSSVNAIIGTEAADWLANVEASFCEEVVNFVRHVGHTADGLADCEKLQLRFIATLLVNGTSSSDIMTAQINEEDLRAYFHLTLLSDQAALRQFLRYNPQSSPHFVEIMSKHLQNLVACSDGTTSPDKKCELAIRLATFLRDVGRRSKAYAVIVRQARKENALLRSKADDIEAFDQHLLERMRVIEKETYRCADAAEKVLQVLAVGDASEDEVILNTNKAAEGVFWKSMTTNENVEPVFLDALDRCLHFWQNNELNAIGDVTSILSRRVVERLPEKENNPLFARFVFWEAFAQVQQSSKAHTRVVHEMKLSSSTTNDGRTTTMAAELVQDEATVRELMFESCMTMIDYTDSALPKDASDYAAAAAFGIQTYTDCVTLLLSGSNACQAPQDVFATILDLVMSLENCGVLDATLAPQPAETLFDSIRMARAATNDREHALLLAEAVLV